MSFFICSNCGFGSATYLGKCPDCGEWNTLTKHVSPDEKATRKSTVTHALNTINFATISAKDATRTQTGIYEFDRVLGGGIVSGAVILLTGEPGIGKSTLMLQVTSRLQTLYISAEESASQVADRARRLGVNPHNVTFSDTLQVEGIVEGVAAMERKPQLIIIDSIQMLYSRHQEAAPGSINQLREVTLALARMAKEQHIALILVGHVTKDGDIAGPKMIEHMVDIVLHFEGDKISFFRVLRARKNRFGSTDEIGLFTMERSGLNQVNDPLALISNPSSTNTPGRAVAGVLEGRRPLFFEIQVLATPTTLPVARRVVKGFDYNKFLLILAVVRKHVQLPTDNFDFYVNVVGGIDIQTPSADLALVAAIISSVRDVPLPEKSIFVGEVGLLGEVRQAMEIERITKEAKRIGLAEQFSPENTPTVRDLAKLISKK
jgi:DNA repair protein RadA/Sms